MGTKPLLVSADKSADLKTPRKLEETGYIEMHAVSVEGFEVANEIKSKGLSIGIMYAKFSRIDNCGIATDDTPYKRIGKIIGYQNHGDILHLERHMQSERDVFVAEDKDILSRRDELLSEFGVDILTPEELERRFADP